LQPAPVAGPTRHELHHLIFDKVIGPDANGVSLQEKIASQLHKIADKEKADATFMGFSVGGIGELLQGGKEKIDLKINQAAANAAPLMANAIADVMADPDLVDAKGRKASELKKEEFAALVSDKVMEKLLAKAPELGLPKGFADVDPVTGKSKLDPIKDELRAQIAENYDVYQSQLAPALANAKAAEPPEVATSGKRPIPARNLDISGAQPQPEEKTASAPKGHSGSHGAITPEMVVPLTNVVLPSGLAPLVTPYITSENIGTVEQAGKAAYDMGVKALPAAANTVLNVTVPGLQTIRSLLNR
jgi:hypothetical protein